MPSDATTFSYQPDYVVRPGETLAEVLQTRGMSQAELARRTGLSTKHVNQVINGDASITAETALRLETVTGISARMWTNLESQYRERLTRQHDNIALEADLPWLDEMPVHELKQRGYLSASATKVQTLRELLTFFGVANRSAWNTVWATPTAYRKSRVHDVKEPALAAWLRIGEIAAEHAHAEPFDRGRLRAILPSLRALTRLSLRQWQPQLQELCASAGVVVVFVPEISGSRICGVARWIDSDRALVQMSFRHKWADIFWFSFFHEIAHVLLHDRKRLTFVDGPPKDGEDDDLEREANDFAARILISSDDEIRLPNLRTKEAVRTFANEVGVHPGIVVGRMQHEKYLRHNQFNDLRERYDPADLITTTQSD